MSRSYCKSLLFLHQVDQAFGVADTLAGLGIDLTEARLANQHETFNQ